MLRIRKWFPVSSCLLLLQTGFVHAGTAPGPKTELFPFNREWSIVNRETLPGPTTELFPVGQYAKVYYVSIHTGTDNGSGSRQSPWKSVTFALKHAGGGTQSRTAILVAQGTYAEETILLKEKVDLYGGFHSSSWQRDIQKYTTTITGEGKRQICIAANDTKVDGFVFSNGVIQGNGGAILCHSKSPAITNNIFTSNKTLKPDNWAPKYMHLTANDGGAVYGDSSAAPVIRNNLFVNNTTENGRGAAMAFNYKCKPLIESNVFISNISGLDDPMRSSDGGGISVFGRCNAVISNNIFLGNKALAKNDGGAIFVALWSSAKISNNIIVDSESGDDAGALFVGGQEHRYDAPLDPIPAKDQFYVVIDHNLLIGNKNSSVNSGAMRFTMEARGEFTHNVVALNTGIYFQRSEVDVRDNIILDNFLFVETKQGLQQGSITNNFISGEFRVETPARVENNWLREEYGTGNNKVGFPEIKSDGSLLTAVSAVFNKPRYTTDALVSGSFARNSLINRVIRAGDKWGVVQSNDKTRITIWGDLNGVSDLTLLPTYSMNHN